MTVYEIPNIENCTIENVGTIGYRITANDGWCIHTANHAENEYARVIIIRTDYNFSTIQILEIATLPEGSEIHGDDNNHEVMSNHTTEMDK